MKPFTTVDVFEAYRRAFDLLAESVAFALIEYRAAKRFHLDKSKWRKEAS